MADDVTKDVPIEETVTIEEIVESLTAESDEPTSAEDALFILCVEARKDAEFTAQHVRQILEALDLLSYWDEAGEYVSAELDSTNENNSSQSE